MEDFDGPKLQTFRMVIDMERDEGIQCRFCSLVSFNPNDILNRYCGYCDIFHDDTSEVLTLAIAGELSPDWKIYYPTVVTYFSGMQGKRLSALWGIARALLLDTRP